MAARWTWGHAARRIAARLDGDCRVTAVTPVPSFAGRRALVTGGAGFIGSTLAIALVERGAEVTVADAMIAGYGGNQFNLEPVRRRIAFQVSDIRDAGAMNDLVKGQDVVFHLAGQVDHVLSLTDPFPDIDMNIKGTAVLMEAVKHHDPGRASSTRGRAASTAPPCRFPSPRTPRRTRAGIYEISNLTAEKIIEVYDRVHGIPSSLLRLTNVYGPRAQMRHSRYGVVNWFVRLALDGQPMKVFGDGTIKRDFLYVDDCVEAILLAADVRRRRAGRS